MTAGLLLIVIFPLALNLGIKFWMLHKDLKEPDMRRDTELERNLNEYEASARFESAWNQVGAEEMQTRSNPRWQTPDAMMLEDRLKREHEVFTPRLPGFLHESDATGP
jgi:hypothetical protein